MKYTMTLVAVLVTTPAFAAGECNNTVNLKVTGLVCDFCARSIEKTFGKREEVTDVKVDLDAGDILLTLKDGKSLDDGELKKLITDAGYDLKGITKGCPNG